MTTVIFVIVSANHRAINKFKENWSLANSIIC